MGFEPGLGSAGVIDLLNAVGGRYVLLGDENKVGVACGVMHWILTLCRVKEITVQLD